jgi:hypothetical protein
LEKPNRPERVTAAKKDSALFSDDELGAAAAEIENDASLTGDSGIAEHAFIGPLGFLLTGDDLDCYSSRKFDSRREVASVERIASGARGDNPDRFRIIS